MLKLVLAELRFRWINFALTLLAMITASGLFVAGPTFVQGFARDTDKRTQDMLAQETEYEKETQQLLSAMDKQTKRIMRDIGVNLRIVHQDTNMGDLYTDFKAVDFPESYVQTLAEAPSISKIVHLVATLQHKMKWNDRTILLVGMLPVVTKSQLNEKKPHMVAEIEAGTVVVGHELAANRKVGDTLEINGHEFRIAKIRNEMGTQEDIQLFLQLHDAQKVVDLPGRIHQIMALNCKCKGDRISAVRKELEGVLPDTKVTEHLTRATARENQRNLEEATRKRQQEMLATTRENFATSREQQAGILSNVSTATTISVVVVAALFVGLMMWLNVRERQAEIGLLKAIGKPTSSIASLFLLKAILTGLIGSAIGLAVAALVTPWIGDMTLANPDAATAQQSYFLIDSRIAVAAIIGGPMIAAIASYLPALIAARQDPSIVLADG